MILRCTVIVIMFLALCNEKETSALYLIAAGLFAIAGVLAGQQNAGDKNEYYYERIRD